MSVSTASATTRPGQNVLFKTGWIILIIAAGLMTLNHLVLMFVLKDPILFLGWTVFNLYSLLVIAIPFRRLEKWAWYATWILAIGLAAAGINDSSLILFYCGFAAACVLGLLLTMRDFFQV